MRGYTETFSTFMVLAWKNCSKLPAHLVSDGSQLWGRQMVINEAVRMEIPTAKSWSLLWETSTPYKGGSTQVVRQWKSAKSSRPQKANQFYCSSSKESWGSLWATAVAEIQCFSQFCLGFSTWWGKSLNLKCTNRPGRIKPHTHTKAERQTEVPAKHPPEQNLDAGTESCKNELLRC